MKATVTLDVEQGLALRSCLDVLDLCVELLALLPDWHAEERERLLALARGLGETMTATLKLGHLPADAEEPPRDTDEHQLSPTKMAAVLAHQLMAASAEIQRLREQGQSGTGA